MHPAPATTAPPRSILRPITSSTSLPATSAPRPPRNDACRAYPRRARAPAGVPGALSRTDVSTAIDQSGLAPGQGNAAAARVAWRQQLPPQLWTSSLNQICPHPLNWPAWPPPIAQHHHCGWEGCDGNGVGHLHARSAPAAAPPAAAAWVGRGGADPAVGQGAASWAARHGHACSGRGRGGPGRAPAAAAPGPPAASAGSWRESGGHRCGWAAPSVRRPHAACPARPSRSAADLDQYWNETGLGEYMERFTNTFLVRLAGAAPPLPAEPAQHVRRARRLRVPAGVRRAHVRSRTACPAVCMQKPLAPRAQQARVPAALQIGDIVLVSDNQTETDNGCAAACDSNEDCRWGRKARAAHTRMQGLHRLACVC